MWSFVESLDLVELYDQARSREGETGRPGADPAVLVAPLTKSVTALIGEALEAGRDRRRRHEDSRQRQQGVVQDRRKTARGGSSGGRAIGPLKRKLEDDPGASNRRRQAARERGAREVKEREALERLEGERKSRPKTHAKDEV